MAVTAADASLNILFVTQGYKPAFRLGGPVVVAAALGEHLVQRGHRVTVVTTNSNLETNMDVPLGEAVDVDGVRVFYFERERLLARALPFLPTIGRSFGYSYAPTMKPFLHKLMPGFDLVHTHMPFSYPTALAGQQARRCNLPLFYHQHGVLQPEHLGHRALKKRLYLAGIERPVLQSAAALLALTPSEAESYAALGLAPPVRILPNGVDPAAYRTRPAERALDIPDAAAVVMFMGRLHHTKGVDRLLAACVRVLPDFPQAHVVLAGPDEVGLEAGLREHAATAGLGARILFPGMITGEQKLVLLARADLFVLPSDAEGFSIAVLEALASETAVLLSPDCHFDEVEARGAGRVVPNDVDSLEAALRGLLSQPEALGDMGRRGLALVRERYAWDTVVTSLLEVYREGIARAAGR